MSFRPARCSLALATAFAVLAGAASPAPAQPAWSPSDGPAVRVELAALQTSAGQAAVQRQLEAAADAWCRANPGAVTTVIECRRTLTARLTRDLAARTGVTLPDPAATHLASK